MGCSCDLAMRVAGSLVQRPAHVSEMQSSSSDRVPGRPGSARAGYQVGLCASTGLGAVWRRCLGCKRSSPATTAREVLKLVGLQDKTDRFPHELSGGEQQRVSIARAFVNRPLLMLCDEPTGNLDPTTSGDIMRLLERINRTGTTVVMATHDERIVDQMRKRVVELEHGKVVRDQERGVYDLGV